MPVASNDRFMRPELLARIGSMEMRARQVVEGMMAGLHRSPFRGLSIEFAEYRRYQPGDEIDRIDWKAYARSDRFYIKEFEDETNLNAWIVLDASASMGFASKDGAMTKWQYGATLAACMAYLLQCQNDAVGLVLLDEAIRVQMEPRGTRGHLAHVVGQMERTTPSRQTRLADALHRTASRIKRRGMVLVVSDLLDDPAEVIAGLRHLQFGGNDVRVFHTLDPAELDFDFAGPTLFVDPETNRTVPALADQVRADYLGAMQAFLKNYSEELGKTNIAYRLVNTSEPLDRALFSLVS
ncbi:DUF58 domain-containing protein [Candidatus Sumerlaeota bacterium]|nr:DUF58 domain-containing protein [Candidatus Sumerlaeota bacterium]